MKYLQHLHELERLLLTWQCSEELRPRTRRVVAEIIRSNENYTFTYLVNTDDYKQAISQGFNGYATFKLDQETHNIGVMDALARRLPPRKRDDFSAYLTQFRLPSTFSGSDFSLLGYTSGKLPSDTFLFAPDLSNAALPIDILLEVAGFRHQENMEHSLPSPGCKIFFELDTKNHVDSNAIKIMSEHGIMLGYVNRALLSWFVPLLKNRKVVAEVERINGKPDRPLIYIYCHIE